MLHRYPLFAALTVFALLAASTVLAAGTLESPAAPTNPGSAMFTLEDLYNRLDVGTPGAKRTGGFAEPANGPAAGRHTLDEIMGKAPAADNANGAGTADVLTGKTFWGLQSGTWGPRTGAMPNNGAVTMTPGVATQAVAAGYHDGSGKVSGDANLVSGNIKAGTAIFGVSGDANVVNTSSGNAAAAHIATGRKVWVAGAEITGNMPIISPATITPGIATQAISAGYHDGTGKVSGDPNLVTGNIKAGTTIFGVVGSSTVVDTSPANATAGEILGGRTAWVNGSQITGCRYGGVSCPDPNPARWSANKRWYDNQDGTITDTTTGLVWLKNASAVGLYTFRYGTAIYGAITVCENDLRSGQFGLTDGSSQGDWRLPTHKELSSFTNGVDAVRSGAPQLFSNVQASNYWNVKRTSNPAEIISVVSLSSGLDGGEYETGSCYVLPVRSPR